MNTIKDFSQFMIYYGNISKNYGELLKKINKIYSLTGLTIDELIEKFSKGCFLKQNNQKNFQQINEKGLKNGFCCGKIKTQQSHTTNTEELKNENLGSNF